MIPVFLVLVVACWALYQAAVWSKAVRQNKRKAEKSGWPQYFSPLHVNDTAYLVFHKIIASLTKWLPQDRMRSWFPWTVLLRVWHAGYEPFEEIGSDSFMLYTSTGNMLVTSDPSVSEQIYNHPADFRSPVDVMSMYNIYGPTLAASEDEDWRRHRKVTTPYFNSETNIAVWKESITQTESLLGTWSDVSWKVVDAKSQLTARVIMKMFGNVFFGKEIQWEDYDTVDQQDYTRLKTFGQAVIGVTQNMGVVLLLRALPSWMIKMLPFKLIRFVEHADREFGQHMENMHQDVSNQLNKSAQGKRFKTLLESIISAGQLGADAKDSKEDLGFTRSEVYGNMFFFITAGYETSSTTAAFTLLLLALHPTYQENLIKHVDSVLGGRDPADWNLDDFSTLFDGYLGAVIKETLRLYSPVEWLPKRAINDVEITSNTGKACVIPRDTICLLDFAATFRHPQHWATQDQKSPALQYNPDNWLSTGVEDPSMSFSAFFPFSRGRRACPGKRFAEIQMTAMLARIFLDYKVEYIPAEADVQQAAASGMSQEWVQEKTRQRALDGLYDGIGFSHGIYPARHLPLRFVKRVKA